MNSPAVPDRARAAVFRAVRGRLEIEQFALPRLRGSEALVRIRCATICGSDLHSYHGRRPSPMPCILGHEMVGELVAMGPEGVFNFRGEPLSPGDRVTWSMVWSCGECYYCRRNLRSKCEQLMKFGHEPLSPDRTFLGGMAEYCHLPAKTAIFKVPASIPDAVASSANCATATIAAILRHAGSVTDQTVVVQGAGMLGQTACAMASDSGAAQVIVLEPDAMRRTQALRFGATTAIDSSRSPAEIRQQIRDLTAGRGADCGIELAGTPEAVELGVSLLRPGGRLMLAGSTFPGRPISLSAEQIVRQLHSLIGVYNYNPEDLETALDFLAQTQDRFPFANLAGATFSLDEINEAFDYAEQKRPPRVAILP